jgi:LytS/YehU family sensor histidine kinase
VRSEEQMKAQLAQAELRALRAQVNPHFLFNALNAIAALIPLDPVRAEAMTERLAEIFRYTLQGSERERVPLREELDFVRAYLEIEHARMGERLRVEESIAPDALDCDVPPLVLQPLVENAVIHGAASRPEGGTVRIVARREGQSLRLEVVDDGPGFDPSADGDGFGLHSVRERVRVLGPGHALTVESSPDRGTHAHLMLPVIIIG